MECADGDKKDRVYFAKKQYICWKAARVTFRVIKFGLYVTVDDSGNYVTFQELNVRIKIKK